MELPSTGSYLLLDSGDDDFIGLGGTYLYTRANADIRLSYQNGGLHVAVQGDQRWMGSFLPPAGQSLGSSASYDWSALTAGEFNPLRLSWMGDGRGCQVVDGSWAVQGLRLAGERVIAADLSFEQTCEHSQSPLRGRLRWLDDDTTAPPGPLVPPADLWQLPTPLVPASGNYFFLHSPAGAFLGEGRNRLFNTADSSFWLGVTDDAKLALTLDDATSRWTLQLEPMAGLNRLVPGYYGNLMRLVARNPARGGMDFFGAARGCNELSGWFVIDSISYEGPAISAVALRFGLLCEGRSPPVHGQLRWER